MLTIRPDLMKFPAPGLNGGGLGAPGDVILNGVKVTRFTPIAWQPGDEVILRVPGGAGFGDPQTASRNASTKTWSWATSAWRRRGPSMGSISRSIRRSSAWRLSGMRWGVSG